jgi:hypothetical protein
MSSVLSGISQNSRSGNLLVTLSANGFFFSDATIGSATLLEGLTAVTAANGLVRATGTNFVFGTTTQVVAASALGGSLSSYTTRYASVLGTLFKDMGKNIYIFTQGSTGATPPLLYLVLTRVMQVSGQTGTGSDSNNLTEQDSAGRMGYMVTWSANSTVSAAANNLVVARIGHGHGF